MIKNQLILKRIPAIILECFWNLSPTLALAAVLNIIIVSIHHEVEQKHVEQAPQKSSHAHGEANSVAMATMLL